MAGTPLSDSAVCVSYDSFESAECRYDLRAARRVQRIVSPQNGQALEKLGHAIEYLVDEFVYNGGIPSANHPQIQAIQLLIKLNLEIYESCPPRPVLRNRIRLWGKKIVRWLKS